MRYISGTAHFRPPHVQLGSVQRPGATACWWPKRPALAVVPGEAPAADLVPSLELLLLVGNRRETDGFLQSIHGNRDGGIYYRGNLRIRALLHSIQNTSFRVSQRRKQAFALDFSTLVVAADMWSMNNCWIFKPVDWSYTTRRLPDYPRIIF